MDRRRPAHMAPVDRHNAPTIVLVTLCVRPRTAVLDNAAFHRVFRDGAAEADAWSVGLYVIMPDHIHAFCRPAREPRIGVKPWSTYLKRSMSRRLGFREWRWQADCWDTQMRDQRHYAERYEYVIANPVRAGLVGRADDWAYRGTLNVLEW
jgi:putative transposase